jgi:hypothetical protein
MKRLPKKIHEINITSSISVPDHMELITLENEKYTKLSDVNFSGIPLSAPSCKAIGRTLIYAPQLTKLDVSSCKL